MATPANKASTRSQADAPLTDAADLLALAGRFLGSVILTFFSILCLVRHEYGALTATAAGSLFLQWMTIKLWRRLRDERIAAKEARAGVTATEETP